MATQVFVNQSVTLTHEVYTTVSRECHLIQQGSGCQVNDDSALNITVLMDTVFGMCTVSHLTSSTNPYSLTPEQKGPLTGEAPRENDVTEVIRTTHHDAVT